MPRSPSSAHVGARRPSISRAARLPALRSLRACALLGSIGCATAPPPSQSQRTRCTDRPAVIASPAGVAQLAACTTLAGLTVRSGAALDISRLAATAITGDLVLGPTVAVTDLTLSALRSVDGAIRVVSNGALQGLYLPRLERAASITIDGNVALTTISLPRLATVHGALAITDNASLELVDAPALTALDGALVLTRNPALTLVDAGQLRRAASLHIDAPRLPADTAAQLRGISTAPPP